MTKQCPHAVGKTGCSQDAQEPCPKGYFNCKKVVKDKVVKGYAWIGCATNAVCLSSVKPFGKWVVCTAYIKAADYEKLRKNK